MEKKLESWQLHISRYITADFAHYACWHTDSTIEHVLCRFWETPMYWDDTVEQQAYFDWLYEEGIEFDDDRARDCVTILLEYLEKEGYHNHYDMMTKICKDGEMWGNFITSMSTYYGDDFMRECAKNFITAFDISYGAHYRAEMLENVGGDEA